MAPRRASVWAAESQAFREAILAAVVREVSDVRSFLAKALLNLKNVNENLKESQ